MVDNFIMIPKNIIHNRDYGDKRILIYLSIIFSEWNGNNINQLLSYSLFSERRHRNSVAHQHEETIKCFLADHYFKKNLNNLKLIKQNDCFGIIYHSEFQSILKARENSIMSGKRLNHSSVLLLLAHIRLYMLRQPGLPLFYSNLLNRISQSTGLSVRNISKYLKVLEELEIIHSEELPRYKDNKNHWHSNVKIFVNMKLHGNLDYDWQSETSNGIRYIMASQID